MTNNNNQFQPYRYNQQPEEGRPSLNISASRAPQQRQEREPSSGFGALIKRPLVATAALLITASVFAGVIIFSYPDSDDAADNVPIVRADAGPVREMSDAPGGLNIANSDSTIYQQMRTSNLTETPPVENLLDLEQPVSKDEVLAAASPQAEETPTSIEKADEATTQSGTAVAPGVVASNDAAAPASGLQDPVAAAPAATTTAAGAPAINPPAQSPETLAFVRSVLDKKDGEAPAASATAASVDTAAAAPAPAAEPATTTAAAEKVASVQPAAGTPSTAPVSIDAGGTHYVQLASVSSAEGAEKEWGKIKSQYSVLGQAEHRVKTADLGAKGVFYRIQAGPFTKDKANKVCDAIKAQKPGGCLVVQ